MFLMKLGLVVVANLEIQVVKENISSTQTSIFNRWRRYIMEMTSEMGICNGCKYYLGGTCEFGGGCFGPRGSETCAWVPINLLDYNPEKFFSQLETIHADEVAHRE